MNDAPDTTAARPSTDSARKRRRTIIGVAIALVVILAVGAGVAVALLNRSSNPTAPVAEPSVPAATSTMTPPTTDPTPATEPTPQPTATPEPDPGNALQPTDCRTIYPQDVLDQFAGEPLNDPSMMDSPISRYPAIEEIRASLPGIECHWGLGTEGGIMNAVNSVDAATQAKLRPMLEANDHVCEAYLDGIVCRQSEELEPDDYGTVWTIAEEHFFKDGLWVSTWWAGTASSIDAYTDGIYATIWA